MGKELITKEKQFAIGYTLLTLFFLQGEFKTASDTIMVIFFLIPTVLAWLWLFLQKSKTVGILLKNYLIFQVFGSIAFFAYYVVSEFIVKENNGAPLMLFIFYFFLALAITLASIWLALGLRKIIKSSNKG